MSSDDTNPISSDTLATEARNWHLDRLRPLIGATVERIAIDDNDPDETYCGLLLRLRDGRAMQVIAMRDAEGNGAGFFDIRERRELAPKTTRRSKGGAK